MKPLLIFLIIVISTCGQSQTFDFGVDVKLNRNILSNRFVNSGTSGPNSVQNPQYYEGNLNDFVLPNYNFGFLDNNNDTVYVRFENSRMANNFEFPVFARYTTRHNFYFDIKVSGGSFLLENRGKLFRTENYYKEKFLSFNEFVDAYGGDYDGLIDETTGQPYNDTTAYISWFDSQLTKDIYSRANPEYHEEIKFRSIFMTFGKKFLKHKLTRPYIETGLGIRTAVSSFKRKHFELDQLSLTQNFKNDLSGITEDIPQFSRVSLAFRFGFGVELYRYHFGLSTDYSINLTPDSFLNKDHIFDQKGIGLGFGSMSFYVGVDLFNVDKRTKDNREEVYSDEFSSLTGSMENRRKTSLSINVRSPFMSRMKPMEDFTIMTIKDDLDTASIGKSISWESLTFSSIDRVQWIPKIELELRQNIVRRLDLGFSLGFSNVKYDRRVQEMTAYAPYDFIMAQPRFDTTTVLVNNGVYRVSHTPIAFGMNLYYTIVDKPLFDFRIYAGVDANWFAINYPGPVREFGVNGKGEDLYEIYRDYYWEGATAPDIQDSWRSTYTEKYDPSLNYLQLRAKHEENGMTRLTEFKENSKQANFSGMAGFEMEIKRFTLGMSSSFSIARVDNAMIKNWWNVNLNIGYFLFSKYKRK